MAIESFTIQQFRDALPRHKITNAPLWIHLGILDGEHTFLLPAGKLGAGILIRSSIDSSGVSAPTGEDSIRTHIVRWDGRKGTFPLGTKTQKYITRMPGWEDRLRKILRILYKLALCSRPCRVCGALLSVVKIHQGRNKGKYALACKTNGCIGEFEVIADSVTETISRPKNNEKVEEPQHA